VADLLYLSKGPVLAGVSVYYPAPGSSDFETCRQRGLLPESELLMRSSTLPLSGKTTRRDSVTLLRLGRILNFMKALDSRSDYRPGDDKRAQREQARVTQGIRLLRMFFEDGHIRGVSPDGDVFDHIVSRNLSAAFLEGLKKEGHLVERW